MIEQSAYYQETREAVETLKKSVDQPRKQPKPDRPCPSYQMHEANSQCNTADEVPKKKIKEEEYHISQPNTYTDTQAEVINYRTTAVLINIDTLGRMVPVHQMTSSLPISTEIKLFKNRGKTTFDISVKSMEEVGHIPTPDLRI